MRYFDLHCDTIGECALQGCDLKRNGLNIALERAPKTWAQAFACWIPDNLRGADARARFDLVYDKFITEMRRNRDTCLFCRSAADMERAFTERKAACFFTIEGSAALGGELSALDEAYDRGVRMITLTWNRECEAGSGCRAHPDRGLSAFGRALVRRMAEKHMIVDVSHLSVRGFWDVAAQTDATFVASHSNSRAVCGSDRNLSDAQFDEIVRRKGLVGLNFFPDFIAGGKKVGYEDILKHIDHFLSRGGGDVLAMGADLDGAVVPKGPEKESYAALPWNLRGIEDMPRLYDFLREHCGEELADRIFFENARRFFAEHLTETAEV